jgi:SNF2 family DNA or RNA helicase
MSYNLRVDELDASSSVAQHPNNTKIRLKRHQLSLLHRALQFERETLPMSQFPSLQNLHSSENDRIRSHIGILGDKVGSGKSYVILSLILSNDAQRNEPTIRTYGYNKIVIWQHESSRLIKTNLLVIPHNLVGQWEDYIKSFSDSLKYLMVTKNKVLDLLYERNPGVDLSQYDLIVVTSTFYNRLAHLLNSKSIKLRRVIYDEVDNMNIPGCVQVEADFFWFVTASFGNLLYPRGFSRWDPPAAAPYSERCGAQELGICKKPLYGFIYDGQQ